VFTLNLTGTYEVDPAVLSGAIGKGSLFLGRGAAPSSMVVDMRTGGTFWLDFRPDRAVGGTFTEVRPGELVAFTWSEGSSVTLVLSADGDGSHLTLTHTDIATAAQRDEDEAGWAAALAGLVLPPLFPEELAATADERRVLAEFLRYQRWVMVGKLRGLSDADARRKIVPSLTTAIGLVKHLTGVERNWFLVHMGQVPRDQAPGSRGDDESWIVPPEATVESIIAAYQAACVESDRIAAALPLDHRVPHPRLGQVSLRWVYVHMIEETARHAGHLDILRELTDGVTGVDPV
jgi:hypothetical protein